MLLAASMFAVAGCEPGVHVALEKDFNGPIDEDCIERALRTVASDVTRSSYVAGNDGLRGFEAGTRVTQFGYSDPTFIGYYNLDIGRLSDGQTHYWHGWSKLGTNVPDDEQAKVMPLLNRANQAVSQRCELSFEGIQPREGPG